MKIRNHREVTHSVRQFYKSPLERSTTLVGRCVSLEIPCSILDIHPERIQDYTLVHNPPAPRRSRDKSGLAGWERKLKRSPAS